MLFFHGIKSPLSFTPQANDVPNNVSPTHRSEDHVQGHGYIKVERIIVGHTGHEEHEDQQEIVPEADHSLLGAELLGHHESLQGHKGKLAERDQVARSGIVSEKGVINYNNKINRRCLN